MVFSLSLWLDLIDPLDIRRLSSCGDPSRACRFSFSSEAPLHLFWTRWKKVSTPFGDGTLHPGSRSIFRQFLCPRNKTMLFRILKIILTGGRLSRDFWGLANNNTLGARRMRQARTYSWAWPVCSYLLRLRGPLFDCTLYSSNASRNL